MHPVILALVASLPLLGATPAAAQHFDPDSREYKLMLLPMKFGGTTPDEAVAQLWDQTRTKNECSR